MVFWNSTTTGIILAICVFVLYVKYLFKYWERRNVPTLDVNIPFGNAYPLFTAKQNIGQVIMDIYKRAKDQHLKHVGIYLLNKPIYVPVDHTIVKHIMQVDFDAFINRGTYVDEKNNPVSAHLFSLEGTQWKVLRQKLSPTFTSGQMKIMFQTLVDTADGLLDLLETSRKQNDVSIKEVLARYTTDVIGSCAFGLDCNSLNDANSEFRKYGKKIFESGFLKNLKGMLTLTVPYGVLRAVRLKPVETDVNDFFVDITKNTVKYREQNNYIRKDFMHLLIQLKNRGKISNDGKLLSDGKDGNMKLTLNELAAQSFIFFAAGFETTSTTMTFALYELAHNQDIQQKVRDEIDEVLSRHDGKITYDAIMEMKYMQQVVEETLRKYPPVPVLLRRCDKNYKVPGTDIILEKDTQVHIPVWGMHMNEQYYPNPETFDPERFSDENKVKIPQFAYLPFGEGPRICIGLRFGIMQSKVGLASILPKYRITLSPKTTYPLEFDTKTFILSSKDAILLNAEKIQQKLTHRFG